MWAVRSLLTGAPLLLLAHLVLAKNLNSFAGPFIAFGRTCDPCPADGTVVIRARASHFNPARPFDLQYVWGNATVKIPFDDFWWGRVTMAVRSNNQWKENAFIFNFPGGGCTALREHIPSIFHILTQLAPEVADKKKPCVVPPGEYTITNQTVAWEFPKFKVMPYGRYRFTIAGGRTSKVVRGCLDVDCEVIPKPS